MICLAATIALLSSGGEKNKIHALLHKCALCLTHVSNVRAMALDARLKSASHANQSIQLENGFISLLLCISYRFVSDRSFPCLFPGSGVGTPGSYFSVRASGPGGPGVSTGTLPRV